MENDNNLWDLSKTNNVRPLMKIYPSIHTIRYNWWRYGTTTDCPRFYIYTDIMSLPLSVGLYQAMCCIFIRCHGNEWCVWRWHLPRCILSYISSTYDVFVLARKYMCIASSSGTEIVLGWREQLYHSSISTRPRRQALEQTPSLYPNYLWWRCFPDYIAIGTSLGHFRDMTEMAEWCPDCSD